MLIITQKLTHGLLLDTTNAGPVSVKILRRRGDSITLGFIAPDPLRLLAPELLGLGMTVTHDFDADLSWAGLDPLGASAGRN